MSDVVRANTSYNGQPRVQPDVVSTHYTEVDGLEVIARELAVSPHPRWKMQHPQTHHFITRLLMADETERFECNHCHLVDPVLQSIRGHQSAHRPNPPQPLTDVQVIKTVLREVERARRMYGVGRYGKYAVEALTRLGVQPATGSEWTVAKVTSLYGTYKDRYPIRAPKVMPRPPKKRAARVAAAQTGNGVVSASPLEPLLPPFSDLVDYCGLDRAVLVRLRDYLQSAINLVEQMIDSPPPPPEPMVIDQELAEKARKYDDLVKRLLG